jgi:hypothetical protein
MGKVYFLAVSGFMSKILLFNVSGTTSQHICANVYAYTFYNWLLLQVIYITFRIFYPEEKGATFFELCGITCPVTQHHIPINKYLEKLHDLKMFLQAISVKIPRDFFNFTSDKLIQETS